jgi:hypothetical protein
MKLKNLKIKNLIVLLIAICFLGCQTTTKVNINANVPDASVVLDGVPVGKTPLTNITVKNNAGRAYPIIIEKDGYETLQRTLTSETKMANAVATYIGYAFCWLILPLPLLINLQWVNGPVENQYFVLQEKKAD